MVTTLKQEYLNLQHIKYLAMEHIATLVYPKDAIYLP